MEQEKIKQEQIIEVLPITEQLCLRYLAKSIVSFYCDSSYYKLKAIQQLLKDPNIKKADLLKQRYKEKIDYIILRLAEIDQRLLLIKSYYDGMNTKSIINTDISDNRFIMFQKSLIELPLIDLELNDVFFSLFSKTNLKDRTISNTALSQEMRLYKTFEFEAELKEKERLEKEKEEHGFVQSYEEI